MNDRNHCVFIVDDDDAVRRALARLVRSAGYRVEAFESAVSFLGCGDLLRNPSCLLLDLQLPDMSGLEVQRKLKAIMPIIFITGHGDIPTTVDAMKAGATDFLAKPVRDTVLLEAIGQALAHAVRMFEFRSEMDGLRARLSRLTPREREVMTLVVNGHLNKQAADELGIAEKTIKIHRARVMEKMEAHSLADLVRIVDKAEVGAFHGSMSVPLSPQSATRRCAPPG